MARISIPRLARPSAAAVVSMLGLLTGQALYAARRDLPSYGNFDISGSIGSRSSSTRRVVALGDSSMTGPGLQNRNQVWLRQALEPLGGDLHIDLTSLAVGGSRATDVLREQVPVAIAGSHDVAIVSVGSNDAVHHTRMARFIPTYRAILEALTEHVPVVLTCGVGDLGNIPRVPFPLSRYLTLRAQIVDRAILALSGAATPSVRFIDVSPADTLLGRGPEYFSPDMFHPNAKGHQTWAQCAAPVLAAALGGTD